MTATTFSRAKTTFLSLDIEPPFDDLLPFACKKKLAISDAGSIEVHCSIPDQDMPEVMNKQQAILLQPAGLTITPAIDDATQHFQGMVTAIQVDQQKKQCTLTLETALGFLKHSKRNRIFLQKKPFEIVQQILQEQLGKAYPNFKLDAAKPIDSLPLNAAKPMTMQYQESDYAFVSRLLHSIGVYYYFSFDDQNCTMHCAHDVSYLPAAQEMIHQDNHNQRQASAITAWKKTQAIFAENIVVDSYEATQANLNLAIGEVSTQDNNYYQFPGDYQNKQAGQQFAANKLAELSAQANNYQGITGRLDLVPGVCFTLLDDQGGQQEYLVTEVSIAAKGHAHFTGHHSQASNSYQCQLTAVATSQPYQPSCSFAKPKIHGVQTALVITPDPAPIYTHQLGQVKVRFMWGDYSQKAEQTAWVRVMQGSAGQNWGMVWIPREGNEVLVSFENGDIDKPVVVGSAYNSNNMPTGDIKNNPYTTSITMASMKNDASDPSRVNQLIFKNEMGQEAITINAERDFLQNIGNDAVTVVKGKSYTQVQEGNMFVQVEKGSLFAKANESITLQVGQSKLIMKPQNIQLIAPRIHLNPTSSGNAQTEQLKQAANKAEQNKTKMYPMIQNTQAAD